MKGFVSEHKVMLKTGQYLSKNRPVYHACRWADRLETGVVGLLAEEFPGDAARPIQSNDRGQRLPIGIVLEKLRDRPHRFDLGDPRQLEDLEKLVLATVSFVPSSTVGDVEKEARSRAQNLLDASFQSGLAGLDPLFLDTVVKTIVSVGSLEVFPRKLDGFPLRISMPHARALSTMPLSSNSSSSAVSLLQMATRAYTSALLKL